MKINRILFLTLLFTPTIFLVSCKTEVQIQREENLKNWKNEVELEIQDIQSFEEEQPSDRYNDYRLTKNGSFVSWFENLKNDFLGIAPLKYKNQFVALKWRPSNETYNRQLQPPYLSHYSKKYILYADEKTIYNAKLNRIENAIIKISVIESKFYSDTNTRWNSTVFETSRRTNIYGWPPNKKQEI